MATIRHLTDVLYPGGGAAQYATVQKLLDRMEAKAFVRRDRSLFVHQFAPLLDRDQLIGWRLRSLVETLCDGSLTPLLTHLARAGELTEEDREALRAIIRESPPEEIGQVTNPRPRDGSKDDAGGAARRSRNTSGRLPRT
jgi:predicted transcriptional regulator